MTAPEDWTERAWSSVVLIDALVVFVTVVVGLLYGWSAAVPLGLVLIVLGLWWKLGPFRTREQRARIRRRAQQRAGDRHV